MATKSEFFIAISVALLLLTIAGLGIVYAPPDPNEGWIKDGQIVGDWNWGISANVTAHWM
jgi:hypothetical protein